MHGINNALPFVPVNIGLLTLSDTRDMTTDLSGGYLVEAFRVAGHVLAARTILPDDIGEIRAQISAWIAHPEIDAIVTTGGTGFTPRDVTPEAIRPLLDKEMDGFSVIFHQVSYQSVGLSTLQSRAFAGLARDTFVFCLPGSRGAVRDGWEKVISAQLDSRHKPCNLVELMPRLNGALEAGHG